MTDERILLSDDTDAFLEQRIHIFFKKYGDFQTKFENGGVGCDLYLETLNRLGVNAKDAHNQWKGAKELYQEIMTALGRVLKSINNVAEQDDLRTKVRTAWLHKNMGGK